MGNVICKFCGKKLDAFTGTFGDVCAKCMHKDFKHRNPITEYYTDINSGDYVSVFNKKKHSLLRKGIVTKETKKAFMVNGHRYAKKKREFKKKFIFGFP